MNDDTEPIRLIAFAEEPAPGKTSSAILQVYIINESADILAILNDLDSINIPQSVAHGNEMVLDANSIHLDFGVSGEAKFVQVAPGECLKITLLLREEQLALLERVKIMTTTVKFRDGGSEESEITSVLSSAIVYKIKV